MTTRSGLDSQDLMAREKSPLYIKDPFAKSLSLAGSIEEMLIGIRVGNEWLGCKSLPCGGDGFT